MHELLREQQSCHPLMIILCGGKLNDNPVNQWLVHHYHLGCILNVIPFLIHWFSISKIYNCNSLFSCKIYVIMQHNYVNTRLIYINMQNIYIDLQRNNFNMQYNLFVFKVHHRFLNPSWDKLCFFLIASFFTKSRYM